MKTLLFLTAAVLASAASAASLDALKLVERLLEGLEKRGECDKPGADGKTGTEICAAAGTTCGGGIDIGRYCVGQGPDCPKFWCQKGCAEPTTGGAHCDKKDVCKNAVCTAENKKVCKPAINKKEGYSCVKSKRSLEYLIDRAVQERGTEGEYREIMEEMARNGGDLGAALGARAQKRGLTLGESLLDLEV
jgi:hypothetical protein